MHDDETIPCTCQNILTSSAMQCASLQPAADCRLTAGIPQAHGDGHAHGSANQLFSVGHMYINILNLQESFCFVQSY